MEKSRQLNIRICKSCGKLKRHHARGLCPSCYSMWLRENNPEYNKKHKERLKEYNTYESREKRNRSINKCDYCGEIKTIVARGLCKSCYQNQHYRKNNLQKTKARDLARYYIPLDDKKLERHHTNYNNPLDVLILPRGEIKQGGA